MLKGYSIVVMYSTNLLPRMLLPCNAYEVHSVIRAMVQERLTPSRITFLISSAIAEGVGCRNVSREECFW